MGKAKTSISEEKLVWEKASLFFSDLQVRQTAAEKKKRKAWIIF